MAYLTVNGIANDVEIVWDRITLQDETEHAQASTTLDIYAHAFDKNKRKAQEKLGKAIGL